tara:strand:+ start:219 stop:554 length:336 start_codon:yes stop_codon:yes gene_type:complete
LIVLQKKSTKILTQEQKALRLRKHKGMFTSLFSLFFSTLLWVQVPQWSDNWSKCAVDVPDTACHWYIVSPDNTFGKGFDWVTAPWFDANGLNDVAKISSKTVVEKLQAKKT